MTTLDTAPEIEPVPGPMPRVAKTRYRRSIMPRVLRGRSALLTGGILLGVIVVLAVGAPLFTPYSPTDIDPLQPLAPLFTPGHWLGTDEFGRDIWSRVIFGGRYDLAIAFGATAVTLVIGLLLGMIAGHFGGWLGTLIMRIVDLFFAFPFLVLIIAIIAMLGPSFFNMFIALWVASWVSYARIAQGQTLTTNQQGYVISARALGFGHWRIVFRHTLPSVLPGAIIFAMVDAVGNVLLGASLGFLGIGVPAPAPEWGAMIAEGQNYILSEWWLSIIPGIALILLGVSLSLIGDGLADLLRPAR
jgi:peptide/nickel transport system permease protein